MESKNKPILYDPIFDQQTCISNNDICRLSIDWVSFFYEYTRFPLPDIDIPEITVQVNKYGFTAMEMDERITSRLRIELMQVTLDDISSVSSNDNAVIKIRFKHGTDINYAFMEVNEKLDMAMNYLPVNTDRPRAIKSNISDIPVLYLDISYKDYSNGLGDINELSELAQKVIRRRLEQLPTVAMVDITGFTEPEVYISPLPFAVERLGLNDNHFRQILESNNIPIGNIVVRDGELEYDLRFAAGRPNTIDDMKNIGCNINGHLVKFSDIANIGIREQNLKGSFLTNGQRGISLAIIKQANERMSDLRENVQLLLKDLMHEYPDVKFNITQDQATILDYSISNLKLDLLWGGYSHSLCCYFF